MGEDGTGVLDLPEIDVGVRRCGEYVGLKDPVDHYDQRLISEVSAQNTVEELARQSPDERRRTP